MTRRTHVRIPLAGRMVAPVGSDFVPVEVLGGVLLFAATGVALVWANVAPGSYSDVWEHVVSLGFGRYTISEDLRHWVDDGLMTVFFFVVGLEIKRELVVGDLRDRRTATLPVVAAAGGMVVPALLFFALNAGGPGSDGWAVPMATDIAFAVVVLAILGSRVPAPLKLFLLTLAIVDDIGAVVVIAIFYSEGVALTWLLGAVGVVAVILLMRRLGIWWPVAYIVPALLLWLCTYESGLQPTVAGVALGLLVPVRPVGGREVGLALERSLHPWSSFLVVPVFALANAGVHIDATTLDRAVTSTIAWGIVIGLVVGKPVGITLASALALRSRRARLPDGISFAQLAGTGCIAGIGFTVSLFVAELSFSGSMLNEAKLAVLAASVLSATIGAVWLLRVCSPAAGKRDP
jgi:NhaA family Na+:H+ antiporter